MPTSYWPHPLGRAYPERPVETAAFVDAAEPGPHVQAVPTAVGDVEGSVA